jgi:hypothetical protein
MTMSVAEIIDAAAADAGDLTAGTARVTTFGFGHCAASCTCGWGGKRRHLKAAAEQDAWMHSIHGHCVVAVRLVRPARAG